MTALDDSAMWDRRQPSRQGPRPVDRVADNWQLRNNVVRKTDRSPSDDLFDDVWEPQGFGWPVVQSMYGTKLCCR